MMRFWGPSVRTDELARRMHPERFAPDGTMLIDYPGSSWAERLEAWNARQSAPPVNPRPVISEAGL